ncbi:MAG: hypothetical protein GTN89_13525 [Acidobacteria bacterium]|nr:hypothetical protein [Acidobacteriota bacterium]NIM60371.1 hypothetical protein [Acidobacteriota bacterium]NIO60306.1 hypothetical protein [Acidobacteriota bacterium]NIQ31361.1 hypothetical protein [Acidobacteriota bacterium]NIQ86584.1 hypothetical protein [Acidobacteriota bacterium]
MLVRLANETGGRLTRFTNDFSVGFAHAQRDLGCQYTIGFYLREDGDADKPRRIKINVLRPGLRAVHPENYMFRSESAERTAGLSAAFFAPELFQSGLVRAHVFTLQPSTPKAWNTLVAVSFPVDFGDRAQTVEIDFGAVLTQGRKMPHSFDRRVSLRPLPGTSTHGRRFMFLEPARLAPGEYELTVVMNGTDEESRPDAFRGTVDVPPITRGDLMLVRPILGRPRDETIVVRGDGPEVGRKNISTDQLATFDITAAKGSFEPLLVQVINKEEETLGRNKACLVGRTSVPPTTFVRQIAAEDAVPFELPDVPLDLALEGKVQCQNVFEVLPDEGITQGRYLFEARVDRTRKTDAVSESTRFAVDSGSE